MCTTINNLHGLPLSALNRPLGVLAGIIPPRTVSVIRIWKAKASSCLHISRNADYSHWNRWTQRCKHRGGKKSGCSFQFLIYLQTLTNRTGMNGGKIHLFIYASALVFTSKTRLTDLKPFFFFLFLSSCWLIQVALTSELMQIIPRTVAVLLLMLLQKPETAKMKTINWLLSPNLLFHRSEIAACRLLSPPSGRGVNCIPKRSFRWIYCIYLQLFTRCYSYFMTKKKKTTDKIQTIL